MENNNNHYRRLVPKFAPPILLSYTNYDQVQKANNNVTQQAN